MRRRVRIPARNLTVRACSERAVESLARSRLEQVDIDAIAAQPRSAHETCRTLEREIAAVAKALPGFDCITGSKGIALLFVALFPCTTDNIERFANPGNLAANFGVTPRVWQSTDSRHAEHITKHGDRLARTTSMQCTLVA